MHPNLPPPCRPILNSFPSQPPPAIQLPSTLTITPHPPVPTAPPPSASSRARTPAPLPNRPQSQPPLSTSTQLRPCHIGIGQCWSTEPLSSWPGWWVRQLTCLDMADVQNRFSSADVVSGPICYSKNVTVSARTMEQYCSTTCCGCPACSALMSMTHMTAQCALRPAGAGLPGAPRVWGSKFCAMLRVSPLRGVA
eukprot:1144673-Pelagomonas_calceolata.AAC.3